MKTTMARGLLGVARGPGASDSYSPNALDTHPRHGAARAVPGSSDAHGSTASPPHNTRATQTGDRRLAS